MKYLKNFNESHNWNYSHDELKEMLDTCKDILLDLRDEYFNTNINFFYNPWITFNISRPEKFNYSDIREVIETLKSYLKNFGLEIVWQSPDEIKNEEPTIKISSLMNPMTFTPEPPTTRCSITFKHI